ncbi:MliC family protein [uncultured Aliiroseovarius sp.]|uniref:MliC family protein n=1 Tax=Aliiroseovarius sediminis TaxID=2925839 RepID=UPI00338E79D6
MTALYDCERGATGTATVINAADAPFPVVLVVAQRVGMEITRSASGVQYAQTLNAASWVW